MVLRLSIHVFYMYTNVTPRFVQFAIVARVLSMPSFLKYSMLDPKSQSLNYGGFLWIH